MTEIEDIKGYLMKHGIKPSYQRMKIYEYLVKNKNHPTVDMIYKDLEKQLPNISRSAVNNTLRLFVNRNISVVVNIENNKNRYDADTSIHGHFKCRLCKRIYDINIDLSKVKIDDLVGFDIDQHNLFLKGICYKCKN